MVIPIIYISLLYRILYKERWKNIEIKIVTGFFKNPITFLYIELITVFKRTEAVGLV